MAIEERIEGVFFRVEDGGEAIKKGTTTDNMIAVKKSTSKKIITVKGTVRNVPYQRQEFK